MERPPMEPHWRQMSYQLSPKADGSRQGGRVVRARASAEIRPSWNVRFGRVSRRNPNTAWLAANHLNKQRCAPLITQSYDSYSLCVISALVKSIAAHLNNVRFTPKSGHKPPVLEHGQKF
jgi:hypothetical protein